MIPTPVLLADAAFRTTFEWGRIQSNADWIPPILICILILLFVRAMYRRDAEELHPALGWLLTALRTTVFLGLLVLYLQPHWRSERDVVRNSRALLLVDTSMSMGVTDGDPSTPNAPTTRAGQVADLFAKSDFLAQLRRVHDVTIIPFGENAKTDQAVTLGKTELAPERATEPTTANIDWNKLLRPTDPETRIGQTLRQVIQTERGTPLSGIVVFSDGCQNAGIASDAAIELANEAKIPIFAVGLGSDRQPTNVVVCDFAAPARAYPGDRYTVTGYVQAQGMAGKTINVQLFARASHDAKNNAKHGPGELLETRPITLGADGEVLPVKFELTPDAVGRRTLCFRIETSPNDRNAAEKMREADVEIVDRKNRVLLFAGGPMREYQFLRSLLFRDRTTTVDVLLQSGKQGISQDANKILDDFPATREELFDYDCIVAFDPNWQALKPEQIALLEKWVGEQGGGLIVVAGAVYAGKGVGGWTQDDAMAAIRNLYPVEFPSRLVAMENDAYASKEPWPLDFTREGLEADFLNPADTPSAGRAVWAGFPGVYGLCPVRGPKPGATVYARFSDPRTAQSGILPVYLAGQFYGSGSVFYLGSGEMWRLRSNDESCFERFYTKLIRHVSQGRLLRGSKRGVLLVGQDRYTLGNTMELRAQLTDARLEPLQTPSVLLEVTHPDGSIKTQPLHAEKGRPGSYIGHLPASREGVYRLDLPIPESDERITRRVQVRVPDLERENPRRNDALLSAMAKNTGGRYYVGAAALNHAAKPGPLARQLKDRTATTVLTAAPNPQWEETWMRCMMIALCTLLCTEWLIRRLSKLA